MAAEKTKKEKKVDTKEEWSKLNMADLKKEVQKLSLDVKTGKEKNTSLVRKLRKHIAKTLTKSNQK